MGSVDRALWYIFILSLVLIGVAYWVGLKSDIGSISAALNSLVLYVTGRNSKGNFAGYPKAA